MRRDTDIFRLANQVDEATTHTIGERLETRATDPTYLRIALTYFDHLPLTTASNVLCVGCGTGVETRALARRVSSDCRIVGIDHSAALIDMAKRLAGSDELRGRVSYEAGDAHNLRFEDHEFDLVLMHTLISHVDEPATVLAQAHRVLKPGGRLGIFDGDYASITFGYPDDDEESEIEEALRRTVIANPRVIRQLPRLLHDAGFKMEQVEGTLYATIGSGGFWSDVVQTYAGVLRRSGHIAVDVLERWLAYQTDAVKSSTFFGAANYYWYVASR